MILEIRHEVHASKCGRYCLRSCPQLRIFLATPCCWLALGDEARNARDWGKGENARPMRSGGCKEQAKPAR